MRKFIVYRDHGHNAIVEADQDPVVDKLGFEFKRKGKVIAQFHWEHIHGWEEDLTKSKAKSSAAKK